MNVLEVKNLCKTYPSFRLENVSFSLQKGKITGFIGRNGAGKSTTLKSMFHIVHPDSGEIRFFGQDFSGHELEIKKRVGFVAGEIDYYPLKKIRAITSVTRSFYPQWDDAAYSRYLKLFQLDENKVPKQLSAGMKVKYALTLALSHRAELLVLDEPTSGLDPVSRNELLGIFMDLCEKGITVFFSTHITSDLDKCADNILYIKDGRILAENDMNSFVNGYRIVKVPKDGLSPDLKESAVGIDRTKDGYSVLIRSENATHFGAPEIGANLENIMVHIERGKEE
jgi:ABC-2 type transport system ATP-binding protein